MNSAHPPLGIFFFTIPVLAPVVVLFAVRVSIDECSGGAV